MNQVNLSLIKIIKVLIVSSFFLFWFYFFSAKEGSGDEFVFLQDLNFIHSNGWYEAISRKISVTYLFLAYPFSFLIKNYLALRLVNFLLFLLLFYYFKKHGNIKNKMFYYYYLLYCQIGWFILGTNDTLFIVSLVIFFNEIYKFLESKTQANNSFIYCSFIVAFFTRELIYIYFPVILFSFFLLYKYNFNFLKNIKIPICLIILLVLINIPSLITNHKFSYDNKLPPKEMTSNWAQRQYLAQLMVNNGSLKDGSHPTWQETDNYLIKNGKNSLPNSLMTSIFFDLKLTFLEFFKDFAAVIYMSIRQTGLIVLTMILLLFYNILSRKIELNIFIPFITTLMICIFSFIIISYVETRWLIPMFIMSIIYFSDLEIKNKLPKIFFSINNLTILLVLFYGTYKVLLKL